MRIGLLCVLLLLSRGLMGQAGEQAAVRSGELLERLQEGNWTAAVGMLDSALAAKLDAAQLEIIWRGLQLSHGALQEIGNSSSKEINQRIYYYRRLDFERSSIRLELQFDVDFNITSLRLQPLSDADMYLPPPYDQPSNYRAYSMRVRHDTVQLPAILTLPTACSNCPIVLLLHDLGPQDNDHSIGPTKAFRDLAVGLAAEGIASLRYDKRTYRYGPELMADLRVLTLENEVMEDALAALALIQTVQEVDQAAVYLIGLGLGGMVAGSLAARSPLPITGIVAIGASPRPLPDQILDQYIQLMGSSYDFAAMQGPVQQLERQVRRAKSSSLAQEVPADSLPLQLPAPYWQHLQRFDPAAGYWQTNARLWFVRGAADFQSQAEDQQAWERRLLGRDKLTFTTFPSLNHLLMPSLDLSAREAYKRPNHIDPGFLHSLADWINTP